MHQGAGDECLYRPLSGQIRGADGLPAHRLEHTLHDMYHGPRRYWHAHPCFISRWQKWEVGHILAAGCCWFVCWRDAGAIHLRQTQAAEEGDWHTRNVSVMVRVVLIVSVLSVVWVVLLVWVMLIVFMMWVMLLVWTVLIVFYLCFFQWWKCDSLSIWINKPHLLAMIGSPCRVLSIPNLLVEGSLITKLIGQSRYHVLPICNPLPPPAVLLIT